MQGFVTPSFVDVIILKTRKVPGGYGSVARAAQMSRQTLYRRLSTGDFTIEELKALDRVFHFTAAEKELIWRS